MHTEINLLSSIASIIAFLASLRQASIAKSAAQDARAASNATRRSIYKTEKSRKLGELQQKVNSLIQIFKKYRQGTPQALILGVDYLKDCREISAFLIDFTQSKYVFSHWGNNITFESNVNMIIATFGQENLAPKDILTNGCALLVELSSFNGAIEKLIQDNQYQSL